MHSKNQQLEKNPRVQEITEADAEYEKGRAETLETFRVQREEHSESVTRNLDVNFETGKEAFRRTLRYEPDQKAIEILHGIKGGSEENLVEIDGHKVRHTVAKCFEYAKEIAESEGYIIKLTSGYRSADWQADRFAKKVTEIKNKNPGISDEDAGEKADNWVAPPGRSWHQGGAAVDVRLLKGDEQLTGPGVNNPKGNDILEGIMNQAGFVRLANENWHFEIGSEGWHALVGIPMGLTDSIYDRDGPGETKIKAADLERYYKLAEENKAGPMHEKILQDIEKLEETNKDNEKMHKASIKDIRFNSRYLKAKGENETDVDQINNLKEETLRRINMYTSAKNGEWYTLDYKKWDGEKNERKSHEMNVGLGDILVDPDIRNILVEKKDGTVIKAERTIITFGKHMGRVGFADETGKYIATHTGDKFRILKENATTNTADPEQVKTYMAKLKEENDAREHDKKTFAQRASTDEVKRYNDQHVKYEVRVDEDGDLLEQIKKDLDTAQRENAQIIINEFKAAGYSNAIAAAAITNAWQESKLRNSATGDHGHSIGLFQLNDADGAGTGMTVAERRDPVINTHRIIEVVRSDGVDLIAAEQRGASVAELAAIFSRDIERPANEEGEMHDRALLAVEMFGGTEIIEQGKLQKVIPIDIGREKPLQARIDLKSDQERWIFGSSTAAHTHKYNLFPENTGVCGISGVGPKGFYKYFTQYVWPEIERRNITPPREIVLAGMGVNGLKQDESNVDETISAYEQIASFFSAKGYNVKLRIATLQPYPGKLSAIQKFNERVRKEDGSWECFDLAKYVSEFDKSGKETGWKAETGKSDNLHIKNDKLQEIWRKL